MDKTVLYPKVFMWLFVGLLVTFLTGYCVSLNPNSTLSLLSGESYIILIILELAIAIFFSVRISRMSKTTAIICYILYSFLTGLTFASIFLASDLTSIIYVFVITALVFGIFALIGYTTKKDLTSWSSFLFMALLGVIIASIVNIFLNSSILVLVITIISVIVFLAYIIYDMKKVEYLVQTNEEAGPIYGAFQLYLDFINIFIDLLRLFGNFKDN